MLKRGIGVAFVVLAAMPFALRGQAYADTASASRAEADFQPDFRHDEFNGLSATSLNVQLYSQRYEDAAISCPNYGYVTTTLVHAKFPGKPIVNLIQVTYRGDAWMFMTKTEPLRVLVGGTVHSFPGFASPTREVKEGGVEEMHSFEVTSADLAWLASQPNAKVRVAGDKSNCDFVLSPEALALTGMFNERVVKKPFPAVSAH